MPFTTSQVFPSTAVSSHGWSSAVSDGAGDPAALHNRNHQLNFLEKQSIFVEPSEHNNYKAAPPLAGFLHGGPTTCQPLLRTINSLSENHDGGGGEERNRMIYERFRIGISESDCALSLLSSPQTQTDHEPPRNAAISLLPPLNHHHHHHHNGFENSESSSVGITNDDGNHVGAVNFPGIFGISSDNGGNQSPSTLPFHWE